MLRYVICPAALSVLLCSVPAVAGWGDVQGQFVIKGDVPQPTVLVAKNANVKDAEVCAADTKYSQELVVDPDTKGIANIFVYLRKTPAEVNPQLQQAPKPPLVFDQKGCTFIPHALVVQTGQDVVVKSDDPIPHNTHTNPLRNNPDNFLIRANDRQGIPLAYDIPEPLPIKVNCDLHPHMTAYWLIVDHPYAAVTDAQGKFTVKGLPEGEHTFTVWHEKVGYLDRAYKVNVQGGQVTKLEPVEIPAEKF